MDNHLRGKCKLCDTETEHQYDSHIFNTLDSIEVCKYINKVVNHYKQFHKSEIPISIFDIISVFSKKIIKGILKDILGILLFPFSLFVSVVFKVFEWLNDRIGMFD